MRRVSKRVNKSRRKVSKRIQKSRRKSRQERQDKNRKTRKQMKRSKRNNQRSRRISRKNKGGGPDSPTFIKSYSAINAPEGYPKLPENWEYVQAVRSGKIYYHKKGSNKVTTENSELSNSGIPNILPIRQLPDTKGEGNPGENPHTY